MGSLVSSLGYNFFRFQDVQNCSLNLRNLLKNTSLHFNLVNNDKVMLIKFNFLKFLIISSLGSLLISCAGDRYASAQDTYEAKVTKIEADAAVLKKNGFLWMNVTMKKDKSSYISRAVDEAHQALGKDCNYVELSQAESTMPKQYANCDFEAGLKQLSKAEKFVDASMEQMRTQKAALPSYEKPRN